MEHEDDKDNFFVELFSNVGNTHYYRFNDVVHLAGELPSTVYLILRGKVKHVLYDLDGSERTVLILKPGNIFGEVSLFQHDRNLVASIAMEPSIIKELDSDLFLTTIQGNDLAYVKLIDLITWKFRIILQQINDSAFKDINGRLIGLLLRLTQQHGYYLDANSVQIEMRLTHQELANMIGAYRSNVTRILRQLSKSGILKIEDKMITIYDLDELKRIAYNAHLDK